MTITELQIQLDLNPDNRVSVLKNADTCRLTRYSYLTRYGYLFVDNEDGQCYLFDDYGQEDDIDKVKLIGADAFENCKSLAKIKIPNSVESIKKWAFYNCTSLKSIKIPSLVKTVEIGTFAECTSLTSIEIPSSIENIQRCAFACCKSLTSIEIPSSIEWIGEWVFEKCTSLKEVVFKGKTMDEVKAMICYPWEIKDESIIKCLG